MFGTKWTTKNLCTRNQKIHKTTCYLSQDSRFPGTDLSCPGSPSYVFGVLTTEKVFSKAETVNSTVLLRDLTWFFIAVLRLSLWPIHRVRPCN